MALLDECKEAHGGLCVAMSSSTLTILYRGPLSSCNYACNYCPFAKREETDEELETDRAALERFLTWTRSFNGTLSVFFTPWGEALVRGWYRDALATLSQQENIRRTSIQTNLSAGPAWLERANPSKVGIWATWHPTETPLERFLPRVLAYRSRGVSLSVGVVGFREHFEGIQALRSALPEDIYLWINANKREQNYYAEKDKEFLRSIDPHFAFNETAHETFGALCHAGHTVLSVRGDGTAQRCHFIATPLGNLYEPGFLATLRPSPCSNQQCGCHIGYVHLERLHMYELFGEGVMERVPRDFGAKRRLPLAG